MKAVLGVLMIAAGVAFGAYMGLWVCFVGGIVDVVDAIKANPVSGLGIAIGLLKVLCTGLVGYLSAIVACFPGFLMLERS